MSPDIGYSATAATQVRFTSPAGSAAGFALSSPSVGLQLRRAGYVAAKDPEAFAAIWEKARTQNVQIALFGDSNETYPIGFGSVAIPRLNYEMWRHFGRAGLSPVSKSNLSYGGTGNSMWLLAGVPNGSAGTIIASSVPSTARLPGVTSAIFKNTALGQLTKLTSANDLTPVNAELRGINVWPSGEETYAILYGKQFDGSADGFNWRASPTNNITGVAEWFLANTATGTLSLGLNNAAGGYASGEVGPLPWNGLARQQLVVTGSDANGAEFFGARFRNASRPGGIVFDSFSLSGYTAVSVANNHADAGPQLAAYGPWDAVAFHYGVNDSSAGVGVTAAQFRDNVAALIATMRGAAWLNDSDMKFILFCDPYRLGNTSQQQAQHALQFAALAELAEDDDKVMVVNSTKWLSDRLGWSSSSGGPYLLADNIHYTALGGKAVAAADAYLMLNGVT